MKLKVKWVHTDTIDKLDKHLSRDKNSKITVLLVSSKFFRFLRQTLKHTMAINIWKQRAYLNIEQVMFSSSFYRVCTVNLTLLLLPLTWHTMLAYIFFIIGKFHICVWLQCLTVKNEHNTSVWSFFVFWQLSTLPFHHPNLLKQWHIMFCQGSACLF
jgi:hypothetical protein